MAHYSMRPKPNIKTSSAGWMNDPNNIMYDEQVAITNGLKKHDLTYAKVILNLNTRTVERNTWKSEKTFDALFEYFYAGYPTYLDPVVNMLGYEFVVKDATDKSVVLAEVTKALGQIEQDKLNEPAISTTV